MKRNTFYPPGQADQIIWLTNYANEIPVIGPGIGLTAAQIKAIVADCLWLVYLLQAWLPATRNWSVTGTYAMAEAQTGDGTTLMVLPVYVAPPLPKSPKDGIDRSAREASSWPCGVVARSVNSIRC